MLGGGRGWGAVFGTLAKRFGRLEMPMSHLLAVTQRLEGSQRPLKASEMELTGTLMEEGSPPSPCPRFTRVPVAGGSGAGETARGTDCHKPCIEVRAVQVPLGLPPFFVWLYRGL